MRTVSSAGATRAASIALGLAVSSLCSATASAADVVAYDTLTGTDAIVQQHGNNFYYVGDTATIAAPAKLTTIQIPFGSSSLALPAFTYTPNVTLTLYPDIASAAAGTGAFGSVTVNNVTFSNDGVVGPSGFNYQDEKILTFDFTSQNIMLPTSFAFVYRDAAGLDSNGGVAGPNGFSVGLAAGTGQDFFWTYPNDAATDAPEVFQGYNVEARINVVPTPAAAFGGVTLLGGLAMRRARKTVE